MRQLSSLLLLLLASCSLLIARESRFCSNGTVDIGEQCDDGNNTNGDGCSASCQLEVCGNSVVDAGEACDDGNTVSGDGCSRACQQEEPCDAAAEGANASVLDPDSGHCSLRFDAPPLAWDAARTACLQLAV